MGVTTQLPSLCSPLTPPHPESRGLGGTSKDREVGLFAKDLFPGMGGKIYVEIDDLRIFQFPTNGGEHNNVSAWVDSDTLNVRWMEDKESLSKVQADEKGISNVLSQSLAPT